MTDGPSSAGPSESGRKIALLIAAGCFALMLWIGREDVPVLRDLYGALTSSGDTTSISTSGNPERDSCLEKRLGDVAQMVSDKIISDTQAETFRSRAIAYCETQYPGGQ